MPHTFAKKNLNLDDKDVAYDFLAKHCRYHTLNPWSQMRSYANNVRLTKLDLTRQQFDFAFDVLLDDDCDTSDYDMAIRDRIDDFDREHHSDTYFNGRSGGWLVTVPKNIEGKPVFTGYPHPDDVSEEAICDLAHLVDDFDHLCDDLADIVRYYADNATVETEEVSYVVTKSIRRMRLPEEKV